LGQTELNYLAKNNFKLYFICIVKYSFLF